MKQYLLSTLTVLALLCVACSSESETDINSGVTEDGLKVKKIVSEGVEANQSSSTVIDQKITITRDFEYGDNGYVKSEERKVQESHKDSLGKLVMGKVRLYKTSIVYNESNQVIKVEYSTEGKPSDTQTYIYNNEGLITSSVQTKYHKNLQGDYVPKEIKSFYEYNDAGFLAKVTFSNDKTPQIYEYKEQKLFKFYLEGKPEETTNYVVDDKKNPLVGALPEKFIEIEYIIDGGLNNLYSEDFNNGKKHLHDEYTYNEHNYPVSKVIKNYEGKEVVYSTTIVYTYN